MNISRDILLIDSNPNAFSINRANLLIYYTIICSNGHYFCLNVRYFCSNVHI